MRKKNDIVGMIGLITIVFIPAFLVGAVEVLIVAGRRLSRKGVRGRTADMNIILEVEAVHGPSARL